MKNRIISLLVPVLVVTGVLTSYAANITIGSIDSGAAVTVNGSSVSAADVVSFPDGETVTFVTSFNGKSYEDVIESHYDINVSIHAVNYSGAPGYVNLDTEMGYTPYDIFIITTDVLNSQASIGMVTPPTNSAVKIIGLHVMTSRATIDAMGSSSHTGTPVHVAEVFYGTVENNGDLTIRTTSNSSMGSVFNKIVASNVLFDTSSSDEQDIMIQELYAEKAETDDTEISWWRMELTQKFYCDDYDGYSLNDELPEKDSLDEDGMLWFKARNPAKWELYPAIIAGEWDFDNYDYEDYNFWEMQLVGDFSWYNDDDNNEYAHFIGPVLDVNTWVWTPEDDLYINFFGDNDDNCYEDERFDGDYGSAGADFWNPLLTASVPAGYGYNTSGGIASPIFLFNLEGGYLEAGYYDTYFYISDNQDIIILSGTNDLEFYESSDDIYFDQGTNAHWVVEDGISYTGEVPTDDAFNITIIDFDDSASIYGNKISCTASNSYKSGNATYSTMYMTYRRKSDYGVQFTKVPMTYIPATGVWKGTVDLAENYGGYYFCTVATENDGIHGKAVQHDVEVMRPGISFIDYDGDGAGDLAVLDQATGRWFIEGVDKAQIAFDINWGWPGVEGVAGDYDGDGISDLAIFDQGTGRWFIRKLSGGVIVWENFWGWPGVRPVAGDYDGDGISDLAILDQGTGRWFIKRTDNTVLGWSVNWGWAGVVPVAGDYDGDGKADLAVFDQNTGRWFIRAMNGTQIASNVNWGWPGVDPVPGDYNGDGKSDLAIFDQGTGRWFIRSVDGTQLGFNINWGWPSVRPVSGDFNGDGADDLAIFDEATGRWFIRTLSGTTIAWDINWGWPGVQPVGK